MAMAPTTSPCRALTVVAALTIGAVVIAAGHNAPYGVAAEPGDVAAFAAENAAAMHRMMAGMAVTPSGDVDRDFVALMVAHHQGAVDMAQVLLRYGRNEPLRRIAQEIIVDQLQEIAAMKLAIGEPLPPSAAAPTQSPALSPARRR
jgi:hypothetical protein